MLINLGSLESSESHLEIARKYLEEALKKEPDQPFALIDLAAVCIKQTDFATAHQLLGHATESPVVAGRAYELLAVLENKEKGQANLLRMRLAAHSGFPNWSTEKRYITLLAETGTTTAAIQELKTCLNTAWYRADSWQLMGQLLDKAGQKIEAAEAFALANDYDVHLSAHRTTL
jgi:predicted Zn-dependent protease